MLGSSRCHARGLARRLSCPATLQEVEFLLPVDVVCTYDLDSNDICCERPLNTSCCSAVHPCIPDDAFGADIGPHSRAAFADALRGARTVFWNGPMGRHERDAFAGGTRAIAHSVAAATAAGATTIVGGAGMSVYMPDAHCRTDRVACPCRIGKVYLLLRAAQADMQSVSMRSQSEQSASRTVDGSARYVQRGGAMHPVLPARHLLPARLPRRPRCFLSACHASRRCSPHRCADLKCRR